MSANDLKDALQSDFETSPTATMAIASLSEVELAQIAKNILKARAEVFMKELSQDKLDYVINRSGISLKKIAQDIITESNEP